MALSSMNQIGKLSTVTNENWLRRLRWNLATTGKFSGLRMTPGTSYDSLSQIRSRLKQLDASDWLGNCASGLRHWRL
jgi:hypothetical protein